MQFLWLCVVWVFPIHTDIRHIFKQPLFGQQARNKNDQAKRDPAKQNEFSQQAKNLQNTFSGDKKEKGLLLSSCRRLLFAICCLPVFAQPHAGCLRVVFEQVRLGLLVGGLRADKRCCSRRACRCSSAQAACVQLCRWWPRLDLQGIELNAATGFRAGDRYLLCSCLAIVGIGLRRKGEGTMPAFLRVSGFCMTVSRWWRLLYVPCSMRVKALGSKGAASGARWAGNV